MRVIAIVVIHLPSKQASCSIPCNPLQMSFDLSSVRTPIVSDIWWGVSDSAMDRLNSTDANLLQALYISRSERGGRNPKYQRAEEHFWPFPSLFS